MDQIRWRVVYRDPGVSNFVVGGRGGRDLSGEGTVGEILQTLVDTLGRDFNAEAVRAWLGEQEPANAGVLATLPLTDSLVLEIVAKAPDA
jgi:hypothetical protein